MESDFPPDFLKEWNYENNTMKCAKWGGDPAATDDETKRDAIIGKAHRWIVSKGADPEKLGKYMHRMGQ